MQPSHLIVLREKVWNMALTCVHSNGSLQVLCGKRQCSAKCITYYGNKIFHILPPFGFLCSGKKKEIRT